MDTTLIICIVGAIAYIFCELALKRPAPDGNNALLTCFSNMGKIAFGVGLFTYLLKP